MEGLSAENCVIYASCVLVGLLAGYKFKRPLQIASNFVLKEPTKLVLVVRDDLKMGKGKIVAQCCHGTLSSYVQARNRYPDLLESWELRGQPKVVVKAKDLQELLNIEKVAESIKIPTILIRDAGKTQIAPGSETVLAVGPYTASKIDEVTGHLKLL